MGRSERGANLVEMAIVVPLLLILIVGIADVGRAFHTYTILTNAAREGARAASRLPCYATNATQRAVYLDRIIQTARAEVTGSGVDPVDVTVTVSPDPPTGCQNPGQPVTVAASTPYDVIVGQLIGWTGLTLTSQAAMARIENTPEF
jgi:Flp pilus assembly protein TadG